MVHGSGPLDRDARVGNTAIFKELADAMTGHGIATFRYDKRNYYYRLALSVRPDVTIEEEVIEDAVAALKHVGATTRCTLLLGHSLGAYLAPRIATAEPALAGMILLAPAGRPMDQVLLGQFDFLLQHTNTNEGVKKRLEDSRKQLLDARGETGKQQKRGVFGEAAWRFFDSYDPFNDWKQHKLPTLALFAENDYQVTQADYRAWNRFAVDEPLLSVAMIPGVNHVFFPYEGLPSPAVYERGGVISPDVIKKISDFVQKTCRPKQA